MTDPPHIPLFVHMAEHRRVIRERDALASEVARLTEALRVMTRRLDAIRAAARVGRQRRAETH